MGTPTTLEEAIRNGIEAFCTREERSIPCETIVKMHVRDFLAQKFAAPLLQHDVASRILGNLWERITGEKLK
jgi:hypothetical protein